ncbi:acetyl-CoA synthetase-like protein [Dichomitus squalens]|uniref:Acetyl-CoA synthetase-like protein n=1 Tax=Dichomitus squalens TaxID=114155 RepID=A0A4Q9PVJ7_9APHY|nr:acetyl-CoA synthetase-like protein [Dichomitus squalens]
MTPHPTPQGVNSPTFNPVPFNHSFSVPGLYEHHAKHSPDHAVFTYTDLDTHTNHDISYRQAWQSISTVANMISAYYDGKKAPAADGKPPVVGVLAMADTLTYIYVLVAIMSLGFTAFPLSPRNNPTVTAHLVEVTGITKVLVSEDLAMQTLIKEASAVLTKKGITIEPLLMPKPGDYADASGMRTVKEIGDNDVTIILHSSGTTAFPKPIPITRRGLINLSNIPCYGEVDLAGKRIAAHTNPTFRTGSTFALYKPIVPPAPPNPANFLASWVADRCDIVFCVPVFIEAWARDPANIPTLQKLDSIVFSGAPVNKGIGDMLVKAGVTMHPFWGNTEVGPATMFVPEDSPRTDEWEYFKLSHHIKFYMKPEEGLEGIFEPIMIHVFAIGDLLELLTLAAGVFLDGRTTRLCCRPGRTAHWFTSIAQDPNVASAVMFGRNHVDVGVLVEPAAGVEVPLDNKQKPTIELVNSRSPQYAQIKKEFIVVTSPSKPMELTAKGTPRRGVCLKLYTEEIEALYAAVEQGIDHANRQFPDRA